MKNYESKLDATGILFRYHIEEKFPHIPITEKAVLLILSLQHVLVWDIEWQVWKIEQKWKQWWRFNLEKFIARISTSEN